MYKILIILMIAIINMVASRRIYPSMLHPIRLFGLYWTIFVIAPVLFWKPNYTWGYNGLIWIEVAIFFTIAGGVLALPRGKLKADSKHYLKRTHEWNALWWIIVLGILASFSTLLNNGFHISDVLSISGLIHVSSTSAELRYSENASVSTLHQILLIFSYLAPLCGGFCFNYALGKMNRFLSILTFLPIVLEMLFTSGKSGLIASIFLWLAGWCVSYIQINGELPHLKFKVILKLIIGVAIVFAILFLMMMLRTGEFTPEMFKIIYNKFWIYAFGHMVEFDAWFMEKSSFELDLGQNTYMTIFRLLGLCNRKGGVYDVLIPEYGNVFTAFRGVIADFGVIGGLIYCFVRGMITQVCINNLHKAGLQGVLFSALVAANYFWNLYSFIVSPWIYTSYILTIVLFAGFVICFNMIKKKKVRVSIGL